MVPENWMAIFEGEIQKAIESRASGNEGKARVCARRAAGVAIGEYFRQHDIYSGKNAASAIQRFETFRNLPGIPPYAQEIVDHLLMFVDQEHNLPTPVDLIAETRWLVLALKLETDSPNPIR